MPIFLVSALVALLLAGCDFVGAPSPSSNGDDSFAYRKSGECDVEAATLGTARERFSRICGGLPRDCDPVEERWSCASVVRDRAASPDDPDALPARHRQIDSADSCEVEGATLSDARERFDDACGGPPRDCDPAGMGWLCSSVVIGKAPPPIADRRALPVAASMYVA